VSPNLGGFIEGAVFMHYVLTFAAKPGFADPRCKPLLGMPPGHWISTIGKARSEGAFLSGKRNGSGALRHCRLEQQCPWVNFKKLCLGKGLPLKRSRRQRFSVTAFLLPQ
jgi:hypothetical protein